MTDREMDNKICAGYLTNIRDMFVIGSKRCEGEALKYQQNFISALSYAIELMDGTEKPQGEWIDYDNTFYKCPECGYLLEKCCPQCQNKVILPFGGES